MTVDNVIFLPGIIAPAAQRYERLLEHLDDVNALVKDLEVYRGNNPPDAYSIRTEVAGVLRIADEAGLEALPEFLRLQVASSVSLPTSTRSEQPPWMAKSPNA